MDINAEREAIKAAQKSLNKAIEEYAVLKKQQTDFLSILEEKHFEFNGSPAKAALTKGGAVMIMFSANAETKIFFDNLGK